MEKLVVVVLSVCCLYVHSEELDEYSVSQVFEEEQEDFHKKSDPFESINKPIFEFNKQIDKFVLRNAAAVYVGITNEDFRECSYNFFFNMSLLLNSVSRALAGDIDNSLKAIARFVINLTLGFFGCFDPATKFGISVEDHDLRSTLTKYGMPSKPYIVLPFFGASSPRDIIGSIGNFFIDPLGFIIPEGWMWRRRIFNTITSRSENYRAINEILYNVPDPYSAVRDGYLSE